MFLRVSKHLQIHSNVTPPEYSYVVYEHTTLTALSLPSSLKSENFITSAMMKPFSKSVWIFPAAWGAFVPFCQSKTQRRCSKMWHWCYINRNPSRDGKGDRQIPLQYQKKCLVSHTWPVKVKSPSMCTQWFIHISHSAYCIKCCSQATKITLAPTQTY